MHSLDIAGGQKFSRFTDFSAAMVVFFVALPLCLGIALASNAPIVSGLLSGIVGGVLVGALSGSHTSVSGPAAGLISVVAAQIALLGSFQNFLSAVVIAGFLQILMGLMRMGFLAAFFPSSVIKGLLASVGFVVVLKQLPHLVGLDLDLEGEMAFNQPDHETTFSELGKMSANFHSGALIIGLVSLMLIFFCQRSSLLKTLRIPASLIVVVLGTVLSIILPELNTSLTIGPEHLVQVPVIGNFKEFSEIFSLPNIYGFIDINVIFAGVTIAIIASLETLLNLEAADKIDPYQRNSPRNRELFAQGVGNVFLGLIGGLPITSVVVRSSVNINANARSKLSTIIHGLLLAVAVLFLPLTLNKIPLSCLAAILIATGFKLASPHVFRNMWSQGINQFLPFLFTFAAIVFSDLLIGVVIGLVISLLFILHGNLKGLYHVIVENHLSGQIRRIVLLNQVSFLNRAALTEALMSIPNGSQLVIDAEETEYIDADILELIDNFKNETAPRRSISVSLVGFKENYTLTNSVEFVDYATSELQQNATPTQVKKMLMDGNLRVLEGRRLRRDLNKQILATASGQYPVAAILSCIDSRLPVELVFDLGIGDVFSIRMAGNVASEKVLGSLEFACAVAGAKLIVVMGHTKCGAVTAAVDAYRGNIPVYEKYECDNLRRIIADIEKLIERTFPKGRHFDNHELLSSVTLKNILQTIDDITFHSPILKKMLLSGQIDIAGCIYDVTTGAAQFLHTSTLKNDPTKSFIKKDLYPI